MSLIFHNTHQPTLGGGRREATVLVDKMAAMLVAFARTGNPSTPDLPEWPSYSASNRATLLIDFPDQRVERDPDGRLRALWEDIAWSPGEG